MKRVLIIALLLLEVIGVGARPQLHDLDIRVVLYKNGDALISETRKMTIDSEGTECYIGLANMGQSTIKDLIRISLCDSHPASGTKKIVPCNICGPPYDTKMNGKNTNDEKTVFRNNTGKTALSLSDCFLKTS